MPPWTNVPIHSSVWFWYSHFGNGGATPSNLASGAPTLRGLAKFLVNSSATVLPRTFWTRFLAGTAMILVVGWALRVMSLPAAS